MVEDQLPDSHQGVIPQLRNNSLLSARRSRGGGGISGLRPRPEESGLLGFFPPAELFQNTNDGGRRVL